MIGFAAAGPSAYWYLARGTGAVSLVLLTASVVLGILGSVRFVAPRWPRFAIDTLHRDISLLVLAVLAIHIITSVLDTFTSIKLTDAVIPFISSYRPLWMGLGALAFDLLIALAVTSLLRRRLGYRSWRAIHWAAYVSWPVAVLHGLGTGTDTQAWWMLLITAACLLGVFVAVWVRIARASEELTEGMRAGTVALTAITPVGIAVFALAGPLQPHWAARAGTPSTLLSKPAARVSSPAPGSQRTASSLKLPFTARLEGTVKQRQVGGGAVIDLSMRLSSGAQGRLRVRLAGSPAGGGGLSMTGSQVDLLADGLPAVMTGHIVSLQGDQFLARVSGAGSVLDLQANLNINSGAGTVNGTLSATQLS